MSPCKANVLWLGIFLEEDRGTQKIPLNYVLNYAPGATSDGKFNGKYLRYLVYQTPIFPYVYVSPCEAHVLRLGIFLEDDRETQKIPLSYALNYAPGATSDGKFHSKFLRYSVYPTTKFSICIRECF